MSPDGVTGDWRALREEVARLNAHRYIRIQNSVPRMLAFSFARGLALGLGYFGGGKVPAERYGGLQDRAPVREVDVGDDPVHVQQQGLRRQDGVQGGLQHGGLVPGGRADGRPPRSPHPQAN